ncbi:MAG: universal stress protein [Candidatus Thermoplasmatota archaeon]|jgi:nucleotide-binding universal stress UspA family protein|nr:universal stress protein [Candidatus Thermoplasmatota archaeon]
MEEVKIKKILCSYDFSEESRKALDMAFFLTGAIKGCELFILNVYRPIPTPVGDFTGATDSYLEDNEEELEKSRKRLHEVVENIKREHNIEKCNGDVVMGNPVEEILHAIDNEKPDLVIMGNKKHGFKKGIILGSVSERVSANSPVSVLIAR